MFKKKPRTTRALIIIAIFLGIFLALNPANQIAEAPESADALSYDISAPVSMHPTKVGFTAGFETAAAICETNEEFERYVEIFKPLNGKEIGFYSFKYNKEALEGWDFQVYLQPNLNGYEDFDAFKEAYTICGIEKIKVPYAMNDKWLMFTNVCETETGEISENCQKAKEAIESSLKLTMGDLPKNTEPLKYFDAEDQTESDSEDAPEKSSDEMQSSDENEDAKINNSDNEKNDKEYDTKTHSTPQKSNE